MITTDREKFHKFALVLQWRAQILCSNAADPESNQDKCLTNVALLELLFALAQIVEVTDEDTGEALTSPPDFDAVLLDMGIIAATGGKSVGWQLAKAVTFRELKTVIELLRISEKKYRDFLKAFADSARRPAHDPA